MTTDARIRYQTVEFGSTDIHLCTLRDKQQFSDPEGLADSLGISSATWPLFGVIWPSSMVLAHYMSDNPTQGRRVLEVGCGMALSSLLLNKQNADITATDYHPEAGFFLRRNTRLNHGKVIDFERTNWSDRTDKLGRFDLIIGSDLLYEDENIKLLAGIIERHANSSCEIVLVDPGRGRQKKLRTLMETYGFHSTQALPLHTHYLERPFKGRIVKFWRDL